MKFILFESALVALAVLEELDTFAIEHTVVPIPLVLFMTALSIENSPSTLHSIPKLPFIPAAITPPKGAFSITLSCLKLSFINITFLSSPVIDASAFLLIKLKFANIIISSGKVKLALSLKLSIMKLSTNDLLSIFEEADSLTMRPIDFNFPNINNLRILEEFRTIKCWVYAKHNRTAIFHSQQFF